MQIDIQLEAAPAIQTSMKEFHSVGLNLWS